MAQIENKKIKASDITWTTLLGNKDVVLALMVCFFSGMNLVFFEGYIAIYLVKLGLNQNNVGYVMASENITYLPMCIFLPDFFGTSISYKFQFCVGMLGYGLTCFLIGPSKILGLSPNYWYICAAFPLLGAFNYFAFIPLIPEMLEAM